MNTKNFILLHKNDDIYKLALKKAPKNVNLTLAIQQINGYQFLIHKVPSWAKRDDIIYPQKIALEQCSSENAAIFKSKIIHDFVDKNKFSIADLTGGMGIDCFFISKYASTCHYVEQNPELCNIAEHNFSIIASNVNIHNSSAENFINDFIKRKQKLDIVYIDPARRGKHGQKLISISDCQPDVISLKERLFKITNKIVIKLSPMLDISLAIKELPEIKSIYIVSINNECKELLLFISPGNNNKVEINAVNIDNNGSTSEILTGNSFEENNLSATYAQCIEKYIYEPYTSYLKSGLYKSIGLKYNTNKLHINSHLYTSKIFINNFPGRKFEVLEVIDFDKKNAKSLFKSIRQANITIRNFPISANDMHKLYKIKDGGDIYIFATTTLNDNKVLIVCKKAF